MIVLGSELVLTVGGMRISKSPAFVGMGISIMYEINAYIRKRYVVQDKKNIVKAFCVLENV